MDAIFLKMLHELVWKDDDNMSQETLETLQNLITKELCWLEVLGKMKLSKLDNGYIKEIKIL